MKYLILSGILTLALFSGCSTEDGGCCESMKAQTKPSDLKDYTPKGPIKPTAESDYKVKNPTPIARPTPAPKETGDPVVVTPPANNPVEPSFLPPTAVITPEQQILKAGEPITFSCASSYDNDEQGKEIKTCEWIFECHKRDGYTCNCPKKGNLGVDVVITPHPDADYMIAHLIVTDNEGERNETSLRFEVIQ